MSILGWIMLGLIAGIVGSRIVGKSGEGLLLDVILGIIGAMVGGFVFTSFGGRPVIRFDSTSMLVAVIGAVAVLSIHHAVLGRRTRE